MKVLLIVIPILFMIALSGSEKPNENITENNRMSPHKKKNPQCPQGQEFSRCGPPCPQTCEFVQKPCTRHQTQKCQPGCYCPDGFIKTENGECKPAKLACCPPYEEFKCGSACQPWCRNYWKPCPIQTVACTNTCYCIEGYARNQFGKCVPIEYCPRDRFDPVCAKPNEYFNKCTRECEKSCDHLNAECPFDQCYANCVCRNGYVRDDQRNCVRENECPNEETCNKPNEYFNICAKSCESTCEVPLPVCTNRCVPKCVCRESYIRNDEGRCIPMEQCPGNKNITSIMCPCLNEEFNPCAKSCQPTCDKPQPACTNDCNPMCVCLEGHVRDQNNVCIPVKSCPNYNNYLCAANEVYNECGSACQATCAEPVKPCPRRAICDSRCHCKKGYVRQYLNGPCVALAKCSETTNQGVCLHPNEEYRNCDSPCEATCEKPTIADFCEMVPCVSGCFCKSHFIRDEHQNCIPQEQCFD